MKDSIQIYEAPVINDVTNSYVLKEGGESDEESDIDNLQKKNSLPKPAVRERMYHADWLRMIVVHCAIYVHCLMNAADSTGTNNQDFNEKKEGYVKTMN